MGNIKDKNMYKRNLSIILGIAVLAFAALACSVNVNLPRVETSETVTLEINEPAPSGEARVAISMGAGDLEITGGSRQMVEGTIRTNVEMLKPVLNRDGSKVEITQKGEWKGLPPSKFINEWKLKLGGAPTDLVINAGAYRGSLDLGGIPLSRLEIADGASSVKVIFSTPNSGKMSLLLYRTGASTVELLNLGNANFEEMIFEGGAGTNTLDFSGALRQKGTVRISGGVSSNKIIIPEGTPAEIRITGAITDIATVGTWKVVDKTYRVEGSGPGLVITVDMSLGRLELIQKEAEIQPADSGGGFLEGTPG